MNLKEIDIIELKECIKVAYEGDIDLLTTYHVDNFSLDEAVNSTLQMIEITSHEIAIFSYAVCNESGVIGYLTIAKNNLYSFGINIKHRNKETLKMFWDKINETLKYGFICTLYPNNTRAINWLKKSGMTQSDTITLIKNQ